MTQAMFDETVKRLLAEGFVPSGEDTAYAHFAKPDSDSTALVLKPR